jgi:LmbE family N-acetylglucosaminyl deacetylase
MLYARLCGIKYTMIAARPIARRLLKLRRFVQPMDQAADVLSRMVNLPLVDTTTITEKQPILILAPHTDDESLGCGGLIAQACAAGETVYVAILTDGTGSHPNSQAFPPARLKALRERETADAVATLGLQSDHLSFLEYTDASAPLGGRPLTQAAERLAEYVRIRGIATVCASWKSDPHCDHIAAHRIAVRASLLTKFRHLSYAVWGWTLPGNTWLPRSPIEGLRLDISGLL